MIIPVAFKLVRESTREQFSSDAPLSDVVFPPYARVKFSVDVLDVETGEGHGLSGLLLVDAEERDPYRAGGARRQWHGSSDEHKDYLRRLRAAIDEVLGEKDDRLWPLRQLYDQVSDVRRNTHWDVGDVVDVQGELQYNHTKREWYGPIL